MSAEEKRVHVKTRLDAGFNVTLDLEQARSLSALTYYGFDAFWKMYVTHLGCHIQGTQSGLKSLFSLIDKQLEPELRRISDLEEQLKKATP